MILKPFDQIEKADIDALIADAVAEGRRIEYKRELPGRNDETKKEFLADVSSFANASGGDILYGVAEDKGVPTDAPGIAIADTDAEILRLESIIRNGVAPRIPGLHTRPIIGFTQGPVLLIHVPRSFSSPHMVTLGGTSRFFTRTSAGKHQMSVDEIRSAFALSESMPEKIRRLRADRLAAILAGDTPIVLHAGPKMVLHLVPFSAFGMEFGLDPSTFQEHRHDLIPLAGHANDYRYNVDGFVTYSGMKDGQPPALKYCQVFRSGAIEAVRTEWPHDTKTIASIAYERDIIEAVTSYLKACEAMGVPLPVAITLSLLGYRGCEMSGGDRFARFSPTPIDRDILVLPEAIVTEYGVDVARILMSIFDAVWNAAGYARSLNYDKEGNWKPKS